MTIRLTIGDTSGVIAQPFGKQIPSSGISKEMASSSNWTSKTAPEVASKPEYLSWIAYKTVHVRPDYLQIMVTLMFTDHMQF